MIGRLLRLVRRDADERRSRAADDDDEKRRFLEQERRNQARLEALRIQVEVLARKAYDE